jgi:uncharacterized alkaline shock family protein YloU
MEGQARISPDVLARYAADAAREVPGVSELVEGHLARQRGVRIRDEDERLSVELHVAVAWGASAPEVGREVQRRVAEYLVRMADTAPAVIDVVVDEIGSE